MQKLDEYERGTHIASYHLTNIPVSCNFKIDNIFSKSIRPSVLNPFLDIGIVINYQRFSIEDFYPPPEQYDYEDLSGIAGGFHIGFGLEYKIKAHIFLDLGARIFLLQKDPTWIDDSSLQSGNINTDGTIFKTTLGIRP
jgi:hypothetical protein